MSAATLSPQQRLRHDQSVHRNAEQSSRFAAAAARLGLPAQPGSASPAGDDATSPAASVAAKSSSSSRRRRPVAASFFAHEAARFEATLQAPAIRCAEEDDALEQAMREDKLSRGSRSRASAAAAASRSRRDAADANSPGVSADSPLGSPSSRLMSLRLSLLSPSSFATGPAKPPEESIQDRVARILEEKRMAARRERARQESLAWLETQRRRRQGAEEENVAAALPFSRKTRRPRPQEIRSFSAPALPPLLGGGAAGARLLARATAGGTAAGAASPSASVLSPSLSSPATSSATSPTPAGTSPSGMSRRHPLQQSLQRTEKILEARGEKAHPLLHAMPSRLKQRLHAALDFVHKVDQARKDLLIVDGAEPGQLAPLDVTATTGGSSAAGSSGDGGRSDFGFGNAGVVAALMAKSPVRVSPTNRAAAVGRGRGWGGQEHGPGGAKPKQPFRTTSKTFPAAAVPRTFDSQLLPQNRRKPSKGNRRCNVSYLKPALREDLERLKAKRRNMVARRRRE